jgi:hypothetical protein
MGVAAGTVQIAAAFGKEGTQGKLKMFDLLNLVDEHIMGPRPADTGFYVPVEAGLIAEGAELGQFHIDIHNIGPGLLPLQFIDQLVEHKALPGPPLAGQYFDNRGTYVGPELPRIERPWHIGFNFNHD